MLAPPVEIVSGGNEMMSVNTPAFISPFQPLDFPPRPRLRPQQRHSHASRQHTNNQQMANKRNHNKHPKPYLVSTPISKIKKRLEAVTPNKTTTGPSTPRTPMNVFDAKYQSPTLVSSPETPLLVGGTWKERELEEENERLKQRVSKLEEDLRRSTFVHSLFITGFKHTSLEVEHWKERVLEMEARLEESEKVRREMEGIVEEAKVAFMEMQDQIDALQAEAVDTNIRSYSPERPSSEPSPSEELVKELYENIPFELPTSLHPDPYTSWEEPTLESLVFQQAHLKHLSDSFHAYADNKLATLHSTEKELDSVRVWADVVIEEIKEQEDEIEKMWREVERKERELEWRLDIAWSLNNEDQQYPYSWPVLHNDEEEEHDEDWRRQYEEKVEKRVQELIYAGDVERRKAARIKAVRKSNHDDVDEDYDSVFAESNVDGLHGLALNLPLTHENDDDLYNDDHTACASPNEEPDEEDSRPVLSTSLSS